MITPENIIRHELIGLRCSVTSSSNKSYAGIDGEVIDETMKTLTIDVRGTRKTVQKKSTKFIFKLPSGEKVLVNGDSMIARPEDRIKKKIKKW